MHVLITRPEPDAAALRAQLEALGYQVTVEPLLKIEHLPIANDVLAGIAGLIVTSRNGLRALAASAALDAARELPLIAVGPGTAQLARELGFERIIAGSSTADALVPVIIETCREVYGTLAHLRGEDVASDLRGALGARGIEVRKVVGSRPMPAPPWRRRPGSFWPPAGSMPSS